YAVTMAAPSAAPRPSATPPPLTPAAAASPVPAPVPVPPPLARPQPQPPPPPATVESPKPVANPALYIGLAAIFLLCRGIIGLAFSPFGRRLLHRPSTPPVLPIAEGPNSTPFAEPTPPPRNLGKEDAEIAFRHARK